MTAQICVQISVKFQVVSGVVSPDKRIDSKFKGKNTGYIRDLHGQ